MIFFRRRKKRLGAAKPARISRRPAPAWKSFQPAARSFSRRTAEKSRFYHARKPLINIRTPQLVISELRLIALKITYNLLFILLAAGLVYLLFFSEWFQVSSVLVEGNKTTDTKLILSVIEPYLHKKSFLVFPSNNFFFVPASRIGKEIIDSFKRVSKADVKRTFPNTIVVQVEEKKAVLLFCGNQGCNWVDEEGVTYNKSSYSEALADSSEVVIVQDSSNTDLPIGQLATDPANVDFANRLWHLFPDKIGVELERLITPLPQAQEIRAQTKEGWIVYFDMTLDLDNSLALLNKVVNQEIKEKEGSTVCLDYIDLRITDRVFYKMKDNCSGQGGEQPAENISNNNDNQQVDQGGAQEVKPDTSGTQPKPADKKKTKKKKKKS